MNCSNAAAAIKRCSMLCFAISRWRGSTGGAEIGRPCGIPRRVQFWTPTQHPNLVIVHVQANSTLKVLLKRKILDEGIANQMALVCDCEKKLEITRSTGCRTIVKNLRGPFENRVNVHRNVRTNQATYGPLLLDGELLKFFSNSIGGSNQQRRRHYQFMGIEPIDREAVLKHLIHGIATGLWQPEEDQHRSGRAWMSWEDV